MFPSRCTNVVYLGLYLVLYASIVIISLTGDYLLSLPRRTKAVQYGVALADTSIHGAIGALSWSMVVVVLQLTTQLSASRDSGNSQHLYWIIIRDVVICGALSAGIDLDHVIAARSLSIKVSNAY